MKLNREFMDRVIRPHVASITKAVELGVPGALEGEMLNFLAEYEDAKWRPIETSRGHKGSFLLVIPNESDPVVVGWGDDGVLRTILGDPWPIESDQMWMPMPERAIET